MEALKYRNIEPGTQYDSLFPPAHLKDETVKKGATVSDTVKFIPKVVHDTLLQTREVADMLRGSNRSETCKNIWDFVYRYIRYHKDEEGKEQIRSPGRTWHDRHRGVDCDCYTVFISSILTNLKIPHSLRIARYRKDYFQHIYPIVHKTGGKYITLDCVVDYYNYEEPYTEIKDTKMDLEYLSGIEDPDFSGEMGKIQLFKKKAASSSTSTPQKKPGILKKVVGKALNVVNKVNPATVLLRNGVLAAMKLNLMNVASRLKYGYLSDAEAQKRGIDMAKFQKLKTIKTKLENIFFGAGGKPENLRSAILTGKGNKNQDVKGLGNVSQYTPLPELLGDEIFLGENEESLGELGEPVTAAAITAASGALAAIAGLLKSIGNIFPKKDSPESKEFESAETQSSSTNLTAEIQQNQNEISTMSVDSGSSNSTSPESDQKISSDSTSQDTPEKEGFWDKNKSWLKPTLIGATGLGLLFLGYKALSGKEAKQKSLSGTKGKQSHDKKSPVALR
ncbi:MAG: hypothetical protein IT233_10625 [Bacteroidia bacterium]|nr:hypothetical protein [Bacteroidia bacterium]